MAPPEGVELFADRARLRNRNFELTDDNRSTVTDICIWRNNVASLLG
jgi:predicted ATPase